VKLGEGPLCYVAGWGRIGETEGTARILQETQVSFKTSAIFKKASYVNLICDKEKKIAIKNKICDLTNLKNLICKKDVNLQQKGPLIMGRF